MEHTFVVSYSACLPIIINYLISSCTIYKLKSRKFKEQFDVKFSSKHAAIYGLQLTHKLVHSFNIKISRRSLEKITVALCYWP